LPAKPASLPKAAAATKLFLPIHHPQKASSAKKTAVCQVNDKKERVKRASATHRRTSCFGGKHIFFTTR
jgi:hypothetical protein